MTIGAIITIIATALVIAVMALAARAEYRKRRARRAFGPEYARMRQELGGTRAADRELRRRTQSHADLRLQPISADDQTFYATSWDHAQGGFLDDPVVAVGTAEQLVDKLLTARGYPADEHGVQLALLTVQHANTAEGYRQARSISERLRTDPATVSTEEMRKALMNYQNLFAELLAVPGAAASRTIRDREETP